MDGMKRDSAHVGYWGGEGRSRPVVRSLRGTPESLPYDTAILFLSSKNFFARALPEVIRPRMKLSLRSNFEA